MKIKAFALCAIAAAITGCSSDVDNNNNPNTLGSISLSGTPTSGQTLSASVSDPDGISGTVSYYWYADDAVIEGENDSTFVLTDDYIGSSITVQGSYTDDGGINESHISDPTDEVSAIVFDATVSISGDALIGSTLTATVEDDNGIENATIIYTWYADDAEIEGEVLSTLTLEEAQFGKVITVMATFEDDRGFSESPTSAATDPVARTNSEGAITILGTPTVGNELTTTIADEDGASGSIAYQWYADDTAINGATSSSIRLNLPLLALSLR